jgi:hypothetical protein
MEQMQAQAEHVGAQMMWDQIVEIDLSRRPFRPDRRRRHGLFRATCSLSRRRAGALA